MVALLVLHVNRQIGVANCSVMKKLANFGSGYCRAHMRTQELGATVRSAGSKLGSRLLAGHMSAGSGLPPYLAAFPDVGASGNFVSLR